MEIGGGGGGGGTRSDRCIFFMKTTNTVPRNGILEACLTKKLKATEITYTKPSIDNRTREGRSLKQPMQRWTKMNI